MKNYTVRQYYSTYCDFTIPAHSKEDALEEVRQYLYGGFSESQEYRILDNLDKSNRDDEIICEEDKNGIC